MRHFIASGGENANAREASYKISLLVARAGKDHNVPENMIKHAGEIMVNTMLGKRTKHAINKMRLSNDTIQCQSHSHVTSCLTCWYYK
jgi:hypothetical protein